jgi:chromosome segregation ATPase
MISSDVDLGKVKTLLFYLGMAKHKIDQRAFAREKLATQIAQLKKISTSSIKKRVTELEKDIADALVKEQKVRATQMTEEEHHKELVNKIDRLEKKLGKYLDTKDARKHRITVLEEKIKEKMQSRREEITGIKESIHALETLYTAAKKDKTISKMRLKMIAAKIKKLKEKLKAKALKIK